MEDRDELYPAKAEDVAENSELKLKNPCEPEEYYSLPAGSRSILKSVLSVCFALLSLGLCFLWYLGAAFSVTGVVFALLFKKQFGYFNRPSVAGLILSIFGFVFSIFFLAAGLIGII